MRSGGSCKLASQSIMTFPRHDNRIPIELIRAKQSSGGRACSRELIECEEALNWPVTDGIFHVHVI